MATLQSYPADICHVKYLGRTLFQDDLLWLALSGSGIEFTFCGKYLELLLQGDDGASASGPGTEIDKARIAVLIDGIRVVDELLTVPEKSCKLIESTASGTYHIRILKLSEAPMAIVGIKALITDEGGILMPAPPQERRLEFIGDSITCGYGVDDSNLEHTFSTATEDVTKAYAYLTARALHADYSMVSYSGHGIISGYTETDDKKISELVPPYYAMTGFSRGTYKQQAIIEKNWDFTAFIPDLIVINLGTNDDSYCQDNISRQEEFASAYQAFLKQVRFHNPNAVLLCTYGIMNERLYPYIEKAVAAYQSDTKDDNIHTMQFELQTDADGYVVDYHPSLKTHNKSAWALTQKIKEIMDWQ